MVEDKEWTAGRLLGLSGSFWQAFALHAAVKLDLFTLIGDDEVHAEEIARRSDCDVRRVAVLLDALSAMGLLVKNNTRYSNTAPSKAFLNRKSPGYIGYIVMHQRDLVEGWSQLDLAVKTARPARKAAAHSEEQRENFLMGMFNMAMSIAPHLAKQIDLKGRKHLLDLGGGPGTYAIHFCLENPELEAAVYDLPTTEPFARKTIGRFGLSDRIDFLSGDYLKETIEGTYDVVWLSQILHAHGPEEGEMIIQKAVSAMAPGGMMLVHDFIMNDSFDGPLFPALFSLNMLVMTKDGRSYSEGQIIAMLANAGVKDIQRLPFKGPNESGILKGTV